MKKLLGSTLALAMLVPAGANAELLKNLKVSGQLDIQATSADNVTDFVTRPTGPTSTPASSNNHDHIGSAAPRLMLKADWDLLDDVHSHITLSKGDNFYSGNRAYGNYAEDLNTAQSEVYLIEANVKIDKLFGIVDATLGRQFYGEAGDLVMYYGPQDNYGLNVQSLDIFRFDWKGENVGVTGIAGKVDTGNGSMAANAGDTAIRGIVASFKGGDTASGAFQVYNQDTRATGPVGRVNGKNDFLWVAGVKGKVTIGGLMAKAEFDKNFGQNRTGTTSANYSGWAMLLNASFKADLQNLGMVMPWAEFGYGSGRSRNPLVSNHNDGFVGINTDYRPGGIYGRFNTNSTPFDAAAAQTLGAGVSSNGLSNRVIYGIGVKATPSNLNKLTVGLAGYKYAFARTSDTSTFGYGNQYSRNIGSEIDVTAEWKHSENVSMLLTLGKFMPGAFIYDTRQPNAAVNTASMAALDTTIRF